jgi:hypothetical protein
MRESNSKKKFAAEQEQLGMAQIKNKVDSKTIKKGGQEYKVISRYPVGKERLDIAKNMRKEATRDSLAAVQGYPKAMPTKSPKKLMGTPIRKPNTKKK